MHFWFFLIALYACFLTGCQTPPHQQRSQQWMTSSATLKVLTTTGMIGDLVTQIGGGHVDNLVLIAEQLDPHTYQLVKGDDEKLQRADLIFYNGLNLEHGPSLKKALKENIKATALGDAIVAHSPKVILRSDQQLDPHIWMDISLWAGGIPVIVQALSQADPVHAADYEANGLKAQQDLLQAHAAIKQQLHAIPADCRYLVTSHDAFNYFARAYLAEEDELVDGSWHKRFAAPEGLAPDSQLSVTDIQAIIDHLDKYHILVLFPESNVSKDSIRKIVDAGRQKGLHLIIADDYLYADAMGPAGSEADTYLKMISHNARLIAKYLAVNGKEARAKALQERGTL